MYLACDLLGGNHDPLRTFTLGSGIPSFFGVGLILLGFGLQSIQYWMTLLDGPLR